MSAKSRRFPLKTGAALRYIFRRKRVESELDDEMRFHIEQQVEKYLRSGMSRDKAVRRARIEFGGIESVKEECSEARGIMLIETVLQDLRYALRLMRRYPGFRDGGSADRSRNRRKHGDVQPGGGKCFTAVRVF